MDTHGDGDDRRAAARTRLRTLISCRKFAWVVAVGLSALWPAASTAGSWTTVSPLGIPRYALAASASGGFVYAAGGSAPSEVGFSQDVERYNPATDTWSSRSPMQQPRYGLVLASGAAGTVYALGGSASGSTCGALSSVERYSPVTNSWSYVASMSMPRYFPAGATGSDGRVYMFGGRSTCSATDTATAEVYDPTTNAWSAIAPLTAPASNLYATAEASGEILVLSPSTSTAQIYHPATNTYSNVTLPPTLATGGSLILGADATLHLVGGASSATPTLSIDQVYDPTSNAWAAGPSLPTGRWLLAGASLNGFSYAIGGLSSLNPQTTTGEMDRIDLQAPTKPANLTATPSATTITLSWNASSDNDSVSHYAISRDGTPIATTPNTTYVESGASAGHSYNVFAVDPSSNVSAASDTATTAPDFTAPVITATVVGSVGDHGWYTSDVTVTWSVLDSESAVSSATGCAPTTIGSDTTTRTLTCAATSTGGTSSQSVTIKRDATEPSLSPVVSPTPALLGGPIGVASAATDATSGVSSQSCGAVDTNAAGDHTVTCTAQDNAGNTNRATIHYTVIATLDFTPPVITATVVGRMGGHGWYTSDVTVTWSVVDSESAISSATGCDPTTIGADTTARTLTCSATSTGGTSSQSVTIKRDATEPSLSPVVSPTTVLLGGPIGVASGATDATSGVSSQSCGAVDATAAGDHTVTCTAQDIAGNTNRATIHYTVIVTPASLCDLTLQLTHGSARYLGLASRRKAAFDNTVRALCTATLNPIKPGIKPTRKQALIAAYKLGVNGLAAGGWLTKAQTSKLSGFASIDTIILTPGGLCNLTLQLTHGSARYLGLTSRKKAAFDNTVRALCTATLNPIKPGTKPARKRALIAAYKLGVNGLAAGRRLTKAQASKLSGFASGL